MHLPDKDCFEVWHCQNSYDRIGLTLSFNFVKIVIYEINNTWSITDPSGFANINIQEINIKLRKILFIIEIRFDYIY